MVGGDGGGGSGNVRITQLSETIGLAPWRSSRRETKAPKGPAQGTVPEDAFKCVCVRVCVPVCVCVQVVVCVFVVRMSPP